MYNIFKDQHSLIDLTTYGSRARKNIHSNVLIGDHPVKPLFKEGDILDGNAVLNLIRWAYCEENLTEGDEDTKNYSKAIEKIKQAINLMALDLEGLESDVNHIENNRIRYNESEETLNFTNGANDAS